MKFQSQFNQLANSPTLASTIANAQQSVALEMLCVRVGIVQTFYPENLTADVLIVNKKTLGLNTDGSQVVRDWAPINAKVCYCNPFETYPINQGDECLLFFADREIESWFVNGTSSPLSHSRMHDETDCIAVVGLRSLPKMIQIMTDCLHLFYGSSDIQIHDAEIDINTSNLNITGNTTQTGDITATNLNATAAASGTFTTEDSKTVTVVNGIITDIS